MRMYARGKMCPAKGTSNFLKGFRIEIVKPYPSHECSQWQNYWDEGMLYSPNFSLNVQSVVLHALETWRRYLQEKAVNCRTGKQWLYKTVFNDRWPLEKCSFTRKLKPAKCKSGLCETTENSVPSGCVNTTVTSPEWTIPWHRAYLAKTFLGEKNCCLFHVKYTAEDQINIIPE